MLGQTLISRFASIITQFALAYFLFPEDFGLVALAYTVAAFIQAIGIGGVEDVLVQRARRWATWAPPVFYLAILIGVLCAAAMLIAAPLAVRAYDEPRLAGLLALLAIDIVISSTLPLPQARLRADLAFRTIASVEVAVVVFISIFSLGLAFAGFGPYAIIVPRLATSVIRSCAFWKLSGLSVPRRIRLHRWPALAAKVSYVLATAFLFTIITQGDYMALGWFETTAAVGVYFFAFNLSIQALQLLAVNLMKVAMPVLSSIQDDIARQNAAYLRLLTILLGCGIPICFVQAATIAGITRLVFPAEYWGAAHIATVLSIGIGPRLGGVLSVSLFRAQGRFGELNLVAFVNAAVFMLMVVLTAVLGGEGIGVAWAVTGWSVLHGPVMAAWAIKRHPDALRQIVKLYARALLVASFTVGTAVLAGYLMALLWSNHDLPYVLTVAVVSTAMLPLAIRWLWPMLWHELTPMFSKFLNRLAARRPGGQR